MVHRFPWARTLLLLIVAVIGVVVGRAITVRNTSAGIRAPLRIVDGALATSHPGRCEEFRTAEGTSARISGEVIENQGDQALIISTEFRVTVGEQEWNAARTWRVPVGGTIDDVRLTTPDGEIQTIEGSVTRCILFIERQGTYLPPITDPPPDGAGVKLGASYPYIWETHCGATILVFDGRWWNPSPPLSDDPHNPPPGWDDGQPGTLELITRDRARFTTDGGQRVNLVPAPTPTADPRGGCE